MAFGQADGPHLRADRMRRTARHAPDHELRGAATDVDQQERAVVGRQAAGAAEEGEPCLLLAGDHLGVGPGVTSYHRGEHVAVRGVPHGARRRDPDPLDPERTCPTAVPREHRLGASERRGIQKTRRVDALAELRDDHVLRELARRTLDATRDHEQPARVRALVDHGDPITRGLLRMDRLHALGHPCADDVVAAREVVRVVRVQALQAPAGAADPAPFARPGQEPLAFLGGLGVRAFDVGAERRIGLEPFVQPRDRPVGLDPRDGLDRLGAREPEGAGERVAVRVTRLVADHQRMPGPASRDHVEGGRRLAAQLGAHLLEVGGAQLGRHVAPATCACARWTVGSRPGVLRSAA